MITHHFLLFVEVISQTQDFNVHVIIVDYESKDIDIEAVLKKSTIKWYSIVRIPGEQGFQRAVALQRGAAVVTDPHGILFMCDLNLKIPSNLISTIRKVSSFIRCFLSLKNIFVFANKDVENSFGGKKRLSSVHYPGVTSFLPKPRR